MSEPAVITSKSGRVGHLLLNRPRAINALTHQMVGILQETLDKWATDPQVETVLLTGSGDRGLCAGGDIVSLYHDARAGGSAGADFWRDEYRLNATIANYPKPFVAIMDGIVLGGGIGLSAHADVRVVTERSSIGMPETGIGFLPDVGGTYLLSRTPGELGTHLALTAGSVKAGDAIAIGMADWYVPSEKLDDLITGLATADPKEVLTGLAEPAPAAALLASREWIDECYAGEDLAAIVEALAAHDLEAATKAAETIRKKSPTSCAVTLRALRTAKAFATLEEALDQEFRLAVRISRAPDFVEGVRAQVIDKDRNPSWNPPTIAQLNADDIEAFFAPLPDELGLGKRANSKEKS
ncbi:enoyl-CoA hydratase/isomerase family protein [Natronoglycomyces albus]|uniref:3-hydroxyisobutyryl-CoA hydrolase n=1 Tax=Natronoglycomyces albus TaxID=2811108 RepID=A0A895XR39_9ACTN|nr:enoyl-CoA hydratase/isomerase family protein [Natronoglycomyces albus]QSB05625.1 enoyl-CoA hydratase/isomerase family protein [Natronoglycomyces albus]